MIKDNKNLYKTARRNNGEKLMLSALTGPPATHPHMYPKSVPYHIRIQNPEKQMLTNYTLQDSGKTGHMSRGHSHWWIVSVVSHRATRTFVWAIRVFIEIEYTALLYHRRMAKDNKNLLKTAQRNNREKLLLSALTGPPATHPHMYPKSVPYHIRIQNPEKQMLTNYTLQDSGKTGHRSRGHSHWWTVSVVSHRATRIVWLSEYLLKIEYCPLVSYKNDKEQQKFV